MTAPSLQHVAFTDLKQNTEGWFARLRDQLCETFEKIEDELTGMNGNAPAGRFERKDWERLNEDGSKGGGGVMSMMRGRVFEKVGVNISTVYGVLPYDLRSQIAGAAKDGRFYATGISLVAHMQSPLVPAAHMNLRLIATEKAWFGGGADLTPTYPDDKDTAHFHAALRDACAAHSASYYTKFKKQCDEYFFLPHRNESRGVGGIFFDHIDSGSHDRDLAFVQDVGKAFLAVFPEIVREHMNKDWIERQKEAQQIKRGRYVEFNLMYDKGTTFGLKTGGNIEAILMSLPPEAKWP